MGKTRNPHFPPQSTSALGHSPPPTHVFSHGAPKGWAHREEPIFINENEKTTAASLPGGDRYIWLNHGEQTNRHLINTTFQTALLSANLNPALLQLPKPMIAAPTPNDPSPSDMDHVSNRISDLELRREQLLRELSDIDIELQNERARYNSLLNGQASISKLPFEVLSNIFLLCQTDAPPKPYFSFAMAASHVSKLWRTVALSTPLLWNSVNMPIRSTYILTRLEAHLARSDTCFLDVLIYFPDRDIRPTMTLLLAHSKRWRRLTLITCFNHHHDEIYEYLHRAPAPLLEHLSLQVGIPEESHSPRSKFPTDYPKILVGGAPSLKFVRLGGLALGNLYPPFGTISTLDLDGFERHYMEPSQFVALLDTLPSLVNLSLGQLHIHHPRDPSAITQQITMPLLHSLRICGPCTSPALVLSLVALPRLESFILQSLDGFDSPILASVMNLTIELCAFDENDAANILHACPSITSLTMDSTSSTICSAMTVLTDITEQRIPWPSLETLTVREMGASDLARFRIMVSTRIASNRPFKKLRLDRRTRTVLRNKLCLDWFKEQMLVENCDSPDPWPADLGYDDPGSYI